MCIIWGQAGEQRLFVVVVVCQFDVLACSVNYIINDRSWHWLWADGPDSPPLVQLSVKLLGSLQHSLLRVAGCQIWHMWEVFLVRNVQSIIISIIIVVSVGAKKQKTQIKQRLPFLGFHKCNCF